MAEEGSDRIGRDRSRSGGVVKFIERVYLLHVRAKSLQRSMFESVVAASCTALIRSLSESGADWSAWACRVIAEIDPMRPVPKSDQEAREVIESILKIAKVTVTTRPDLGELQRRVAAMTDNLREAKR